MKISKIYSDVLEERDIIVDSSSLVFLIEGLFSSKKKRSVCTGGENELFLHKGKCKKIFKMQCSSVFQVEYSNSATVKFLLCGGLPIILLEVHK